MLKIFSWLSPKYSAALEARFAREVTSMEELRVSLLFWTILSSFIVGLLHLLLENDQSVPSIEQNLDIFTLIIIVLLVYAVVVRLYIRRLIRKNVVISGTYKIATLAIETTLPTMYTMLLSARLGNIFVLFTPVLLLYFLFVVLSTLRLSFWFSSSAGIFCGVQYYLVALYIVHHSDLQNVSPIVSSSALIFGRASVLMTCGVASGFVAREIKKRIVKTFDIVGERNKVRQVLGQHVSKEIMNEIIKEESVLNTKRQWVCVMFLDVRNFTPMVEKKNPEEIMDYQNKLFGMMIEIVNKYHGIINQFLGDGCMSTFGAPLSYGNDCQNAVSAALEILDRISKAGEAGIIPPTRLGIGIHYGLAVTGNVGTELRKQYSIVGNVVIQAARIEQLNKEFQSQLLISHEVYEKMDDKCGESLGAVMLKGESNPVEVIKVR